jgi:hypothetical protein
MDNGKAATSITDADTGSHRQHGTAATGSTDKPVQGDTGATAGNADSAAGTSAAEGNTQQLATGGKATPHCTAHHHTADGSKDLHCSSLHWY